MTDNYNNDKVNNLNSFDLDAYADGTCSQPANHDAAETTSAVTVQQNAVYNNPSTLHEDIYQQVEELIEYLVANCKDITEGYEKWEKLGFAFANGFGEAGRTLYHKVSSMNDEYNQRESDMKYNSFLRSSTTGTPITIKTFFKLAQDLGGINLSEWARKRMRKNGYQQRLGNGENVESFKMSSIKNTENSENTAIIGNLDYKMSSDTLTLSILPQSAKQQTAAIKESLSTFSDKIPREDLPSVLHPILDNYEGPVNIDKILLAILNMLAGLAGGTKGIYGIYDKRKVYPSLYTLFTGEAGTSKGDLIFAKQLAYSVKTEMGRQYEKQMEEYREELAAYEDKNKGKKKGERGIPPKEPKFRTPFIPGNSTCSAMYQALDANGGWGIIYETEGDTISNMLESDHGDYSFMMRMAFHHEDISMNRVTEKVHIDIESPRLSIFITCTPGQVVKLFPSFENGLGSRFLFYILPNDKVEFKNVFASQDTSMEDVYKKMDEELLPLYHALQERKEHPIQFVMSDAQQKEFLSNFQEVLKDYFSMLGSGFKAFVYRAALSCFRYAMVLSLLRRLSDWNKKDPIFSDDENALVCDDRDFHTAIAIVSTLGYHTSRVYSMLAKEGENPFANTNVKLTQEEMRLFKALPEGEFTTGLCKGTAKQLNISDSTANRLLKKTSCDSTVIIPVRHGVYRKCTGKE